VQVENGDIVAVQNIIMGHDGHIGIVFKKFRSYDNLFIYPLESKTIGIVKLASVSTKLHHCNATEAARKYVVLPCKDSFIGIPLIHTG